MKTPVEHEAEMLREAIAEKEYRRSLQKPVASFPAGWLLIILAVLAFIFDKQLIAIGLICIFTYFAARSDWTLFFNYQLVAVAADFAILIASVYSNDVGLHLFRIFLLFHVCMALLYDIVFFLFWE